MPSVVHPSLLRCCSEGLHRRIHPSDCFFTVAAGYRSNTSGALENVGTNGYAWSSSSYAAGNVNAGMLNFNSGNVNPLNNGNRAIARAVRCVQHLHGAVFYLLYGTAGRGSDKFVPAGMQPAFVVMAPHSKQKPATGKIAGFVVKARLPETPINIGFPDVRNGAFHERLPCGRQQPHRRHPLF